jgi:hypothetical protein
VLKVLIRLAKETRAIDNPQYLEIQVILQEIGKMIGGWIKSVPPLSFLKSQWGRNRISAETPGATPMLSL